ncbi:MAG: hypothetical protein KF778_08510 [Rhodocyclaceae bacterium]|nr:hypothetical protein [Rhodocyclaceae bacterium]MBX3668429.1 hypothetical protein [Rhodocyclaceae bacterium]
MRDIKEFDWKLVRTLYPVALDRYCRRALAHIETKCREPEPNRHQLYLDVHATMAEYDRQLARTFDDLRRSTAVLHLMSMVAQGLLEPNELAGFSPEVQSLLSTVEPREGSSGAPGTPPAGPEKG